MRQNESTFVIARLLAIFAMILFLVVNAVAANGAEKVLYRFQGGSDGSAPFAGLVADPAGNLYGTTADGGNSACGSGCGTVFKLSHNSNGTWTETQLYSFKAGNDGAIPEAGVIFDSAGNLYGTTIHGGPSNDGTVFRLTPPTKPGRVWTETVLYDFVGNRDGEYCLGSLTFDTAGNLYGAAVFGGIYGGGTVFQLVPPTQGEMWSLNVLHSFKGTDDGIDPLGALIFDRTGALYGETYDGAVFRLKPPAGHGVWTLDVIYRAGSVASAGALLAAKPGVLYGTSSLGGGANEGTIFQLTPPSKPGQPWGAVTLYEFAGGTDGEYPLNGLVTDRSGNLYGTTQGGGMFDAGTVFRLTPPAIPGDPWTKTTLYVFEGGRDGAGPGAGVIFGPRGALLGTTEAGGNSDNGTVFAVAP